MGIQGLKRYTEENNILVDWTFRDSNLIIDGNNLFHLLYVKSQLDQLHGGDYDEYEGLVKEFVTNLKVCSIQPYVVFDGSDIYNKKQNTLKERAKKRIKQACKLSNGNNGYSLPLLTKTVFMQVLRKLEVPFVQCLIEADQEAAALAVEFDCPILSDDTDFYIYSINQGVLPFSHFQWQTPQGQENQKFIQAKKFTATSLCAALNNMNPDLLPLFATIFSSGQRYLNQNIIQDIAKHSKPEQKIQMFLEWLSLKSQDEAISDLINNLEGSEEDRNKGRRELQDGINEYIVPASSTSGFFKTGAQPNWTAEPLKVLPDWTLLPMAKSELNTVIIAVLVHKAVTLKCQVEDFSKQSSNCISQHIRRVIYALLLYSEKEIGQRTQHKCIEEIDRNGQNLTSDQIDLIMPIHNLKTLYKEPREVQLEFLKNALAISDLDLKNIPYHLHLVIYITEYWKRQAKPHTKLVKALLLGLVYGELSRSRTSNEVSPMLGMLKDLPKAAVMKFDKKVAHAYSQWQCCLRDGISLNQFLHKPVPEPECAWLYKGSLVHYLAKNLGRTLKQLEETEKDKCGWELFQDLTSVMWV